MNFLKTARFQWAISVLLAFITATSGAAEVADESDSTAAEYFIVVEYQNHGGGPARLLWGNIFAGGLRDMVAQPGVIGWGRAKDNEARQFFAKNCEAEKWLAKVLWIDQVYGGVGDTPFLSGLFRYGELASGGPNDPRRLFMKMSPEAYKATLALAAFDSTRHADGRATASDVAGLVSALATYLDIDRETLTGHRRPSEMILTAKPRQPLRRQARPIDSLSGVVPQPDPAGETDAIRQLRSRAEADEHKQEMLTESLKSAARDRSYRREDGYDRRTSEFAHRQSAGTETLAKEQADEVEAGNEANAASLASKVAMMQEQREQRMRDAEARAHKQEDDFRERGRLRREYWIANGKKMGEMLIAAATLGAGGGGSMMSGLTSVIGSGQVGEITAGANVAEASGPGAVINPSADLTPQPGRLAALETSQGYSRLIHDALNVGTGNAGNPEIARLPSPAMRPPVRSGFRSPARPFPSNRDPRRNDFIYTRPNNEVRPPLPDTRELYERSLDKKTSDLADDVQAKLKTWNWLHGGKLYDPWDLAPPPGWHPPMQWPQPMRRPYNGPSFMKDTSPPHGPAWFKYREVGPEGFDVYEQNGREIIVPRY
jgi:hypothetical protein